MIMAVELARKYAQAFMRTQHEHITKKDYDAIVKARDAIAQKIYIVKLLDVPTMSAEEKDTCIKKLVEYYALPRSFVGLLQLLCKHGRVALFGGVLDAISKLYQEEHNAIVVTIYTSSEVTDKELGIIKNFIAAQTKKDVVVSHVITPSLIAGVRIESDQFVWDYSVQKQLRSILTT